MIIIVVVKQSKHDLRGTHILSQTHTHARAHTHSHNGEGGREPYKTKQKKSESLYINIT